MRGIGKRYRRGKRTNEDLHRLQQVILELRRRKQSVQETQDEPLPAHHDDQTVDEDTTEQQQQQMDPEKQESEEVEADVNIVVDEEYKEEETQEEPLPAHHDDQTVDEDTTEQQQQQMDPEKQESEEVEADVNIVVDEEYKEEETQEEPLPAHHDDQTVDEDTIEQQQQQMDPEKQESEEVEADVNIVVDEEYKEEDDPQDVQQEERIGDNDIEATKSDGNLKEPNLRPKSSKQSQHWKKRYISETNQRTEEETNTNECSSVDNEELNVNVSVDEGDTFYDNDQCFTENEGKDLEEIDHYKFCFTLPSETWHDIKPHVSTYSNGRQFRRMSGKWATIFQTNTNQFHPGCVLSIQSHYVKAHRSRKVKGPYMVATATCKGPSCKGVFNFTIETEQNEDEPVPVSCTVDGSIFHLQEDVTRRNITAEERQQVAKEIQECKSTSTVFYRKLKSGNDEQMSMGNYTTVPNQTVLRKIVSEMVKKEQLHSNILAELQVLKENLDKSKTPFIRDIGYDPFTVIMFGEQQVNFMKKLSSSGDLNLYIDATGSVIKNIVGQKRPYLYSIVVKPNPDLPEISLADMLTTQHTIPRIELLLSSIRRAVCSSGKMLHVKKVETDYSMALVQACLHSFSNCDIKSYLRNTYKMLHDNLLIQDFTVHHLCAAHMLKDFSRNITTCVLKTRKRIRRFMMQCFAALQNSTSMGQLINVFRNVCTVLSSERMSEDVEKAQRDLQDAFTEPPTDEETEEDAFSGEEPKTTDRSWSETTIKEASPFTAIFQGVYENTITRDTKEEKELNEFHCPEVLKCLLDKYMHIAPLWTGLMSGCSDTNSAAENWFKFLKIDRPTPLHARPYVFVIDLKEAIESRLKEHTFPGARKKQTTGKRKGEDAKLATAEELWKPFPKKKTNAYMPNKPKTKTSGFPSVMKWGGRVGDTFLQNTCPIDNPLTILHLQAQENPRFRTHVQEHSSAVYQTLASIFRKMDAGRFDEAKLDWITFSGSDTNLYGDESERFMEFFAREWVSFNVSICDQATCTHPMKQSRDERGVMTHTASAVLAVQQLIDGWMASTENCNANHGDSSKPGARNVTRQIVASAPVVILRMYEHALFGRIELDDILAGPQLSIAKKHFVLAGVTMHSAGHYTAIIPSKAHGELWYDGLKGNLQRKPGTLKKWKPSHAVYCSL